VSDANHAGDSPVPLTVNGLKPGGISRREAIQWVMGAMAAASMPSVLQRAALAQPVGRTVTPQENAAKQPPPAGVNGYGTDPNLLRVHKPGDLWPLSFNEAQRKTVTALADTIIPKDDLGPAASEVGVVEMIDEWISAPYPQQKGDRPVILEGLAWIETEASKRFGAGKTFAVLSPDQQHQICDDICYHARAKPEFRKAADFFSRFRNLAASAYYATPQGWKAIGYVGNTPLPQFDGPPPEVLQRLGVTQTVQ
jgi:hypothetical protein